MCLDHEAQLWRGRDGQATARLRALFEIALLSITRERGPGLSGPEARLRHVRVLREALPARGLRALARPARRERGLGCGPTRFCQTCLERCHERDYLRFGPLAG